MTPRLPFGTPEPPAVDLAEKHRPAWLDEMVGQPDAVRSLVQFAQKPHPRALLFEGDTGVGKTTAALALAKELGVDPFWGLHHIRSGEQDADAVETVLKSLRYVCSVGSGWQVAIVDEADWMSTKARQLWLSALEDLPAHSVVIFTTNNPNKFETRFRDRCTVLRFVSNADTLAAPGQEYLDRVWRAEGLAGDPPRLADLPDVTQKGAISLRRIVRAIESIKLSGVPPTRTTPPVTPETKAAACTQCGTTEGGINAKTRRPSRRRGMCRRCYQRNLKQKKAGATP